MDIGRRIGVKEIPEPIPARRYTMPEKQSSPERAAEPVPVPVKKEPVGVPN